MQIHSLSISAAVIAPRGANGPVADTAFDPAIAGGRAMTAARRYSEYLHKAALKWQLPILPGRPLIGLPQGSHDTGYIGNPYQLLPQAIAESFTWTAPSWCPRSFHARIRLFVFNERWSYCLSVIGAGIGFAWGPLLQFCEPYHTRREALDAAAAYIARRLKNGKDAGIVNWAKSLTAPVQLNLF